MKLTSISFFVAILFSTAGCSPKTSEAKLYDLRCENLTDPEGIATDVPALSWKIGSAENGMRQRAFQLLVASKAELLTEENADLWNSGKRESAAQVLVPYEGKKLASRSDCFWKIRIWDKRNHVSAWSQDAHFSVGLLEKDDLHASFIGLPGKENANVSPQLLKTFTVNGKGDKIVIHVNSLGYHEVWINGKKAGDKVLTPAVSQFSKRSQIITYDITGLITEGRNDLVIWIGHGWYSKGLPGVESDRPLVRAQVEKLNKGSWELIAGTDSTWRGRNSGYALEGTWRSGDYGGERITAALLLPDLTAKSLDNETWQKVFEAPDNGAAASPQTTESNAIRDEFKAASVTKYGKGLWLVDLGKTLSGWAEIKFPQLKPGQVIKLEYSDHFDKDGTLRDQGQYDTYIASGKEKESFHNKFNYHGFRYITISNLPVPPAAADITGYLIHTDYKQASSFSCSDPDLNSIHDMIFYTLRCLSIGGDLVDCPQIERLGYGGDGNASTLTAQTMFDLEPLYTNWLRAWGDCVREDGGMPHTAPNPYPAGGGPFWCGFIITASWKTYVNYGDIRILQKYYPVMQKWLGYVEKYSPAGLLERWPDTDYRDWYLGDWAVPEGTDQKDSASVSTVNNCFVSVCYGTMEKIATLLDKKDDALLYRSKQQQLIGLINNKLFDRTKGIYGSGSQIDLTYPLLAGAVPDSLAGKTRENLIHVIKDTHSGHIACGLVGIPVFTEWSVGNRETDLFYAMLKKRDYPGYLYMIDNGATTTWEHWNGARSRIHNCYNGIGSWFYQAVAGIRPDESYPGYRSFIIDPQIPEGVTWAKATKESPYGTISVSWKIMDGSLSIDVSVPAGSVARVTIPQSVHEFSIDKKSKKTKKSSEEIESGHHTLEWKL
jgi:alpha-L-rhamnosidase